MDAAVPLLRDYSVGINTTAIDLARTDFDSDALSLRVPAKSVLSLESGISLVAVGEPVARNQRTLEVVANALDRGHEWLSGGEDAVGVGRWAMINFAVAGADAAARNCARVLFERRDELGVRGDASRVVDQLLLLGRLTGHVADALSTGLVNRDVTLDDPSRGSSVSFGPFHRQLAILREQRQATLDFLGNLRP